MADDEYYLDSIPPQLALESRSSTIALRGNPTANRKNPENRPIYTFTDTGDPLYAAQVAVLQRLEGRVRQPLVRAIFETRPLGADVFATIIHGFRRKVIDPNIVLLEALRISLAPAYKFVNEDGEPVNRRNYLQLVGLALRFGADPNQYVDIDEPESVHILFWVHRFGIDLRQEYGYDSVEEEEIFKSQAMYLLVLAGADLTMKLTTVDTDRESVVSALKKYPDSQKSLDYNFELDLDDPPRGFTSEFLPGDLPTIVFNEQSFRLAKMREIVTVRDRPEQLRRKYPEDWDVDEVLELLYSLDYRRIATEIPARDVPGELRKVSLYHAHRVYTDMIERLPTSVIEVIGEQELRYSVLFLDVNSVETLLLFGAIPSYELKDEILNRMEVIGNRLPLTLDMEGRILWYFTKANHPLDETQMRKLQRIAPYVANYIKEYMEKNPAWKGECSVRTDRVSASLRETAREVGMDPTESKAAICKGLAAIASVDTETAVRVARELGDRKTRVASETLEEAIEDDKVKKRLAKIKTDEERKSRIQALKSGNLSTPTTGKASPVTTKLEDGRELITKKTLSKSPSSSSDSKSGRKTTAVAPKKGNNVNTVSGLDSESLSEEDRGIKKIPQKKVVVRSPSTQTPKAAMPKFLPTAPAAVSGKKVELNTEKGVDKNVLAGLTGGRDIKAKLVKKKDRVKGKCKGDTCEFSAKEDLEEITVEETDNISMLDVEGGGKKKQPKPIIKQRKPTPYPEVVPEEEEEVVLPPPIPVAAKMPMKIKPDTTPVNKNLEERKAITRIGGSKDVELRKILEAQNTDNLNRALSPHSTNSTGPLCINQGDLQFNPKDYASVDLVVYDDENEDTYCFESRDYSSLLETRINPYTALRIPEAVTNEMAAKLRILEDTQVKVTPISVPKGIRNLKGGGYSADREAENTVRRLKDLYVLYGLDPAILDSDYTIADMQIILDSLYDPSPTLDAASRTHALRSYASIIVRDIYTEPEPELVDRRADEIFSVILDYGDPVAEGIEVPPEEQGQL